MTEERESAIIEAVQHLSDILKSQPDRVSYVDFNDDKRLLVNCKKTVNQLLKYLTKGDKHQN